MANYSFSTDKGAIVKGIDSVKQRGKNLDRDIGLVAASAVAHAQLHGDATLFGSLCAVMPRGSRVKTLIEWVQSAAPVAVKAMADGTYKVTVDRARVKEGEFAADRSDWNIETLKTTNWFEFQKDKSESEYTLDQLLSMLDKLAKGKRKGATEQAMDAATVALAAAKAYRDGAPAPAPVESEAEPA